MRVIIIAAGEGTRWGNYLGIPKHYIEIDGEPIIERTVRLLREHGESEIYVVSKNYNVDGAISYRPNLNKNNFDADKFLSSKDLWSRSGRTVIIYGDCYFTESAIKRIVNWKKRDWTVFCRPFGSKITGTPWGECFAISMYPEHLMRMTDKLFYISELYKDNIIKKCGGWELYRAMTGRKEEKVYRPHIMLGNYSLIDDETEDFDRPEDLVNFLLLTGRDTSQISKEDILAYQHSNTNITK